MSIVLGDGARIGVIGGGPAGSLFAYFALSFAERLDLKIEVDVYEPRDFTKPGPVGCNMCGGIVSESLIQALALEGINLPANVVQRGIDSYVLHTDDASVRIETPLKEKRIAAVHRGGGPRDTTSLKWGGLDGFLLSLAKEIGANVVPTRVSEVGLTDGRPYVSVKGDKRVYDLLVGATGVNSSAWQLFESLGFRCKRPGTTKTYITELNLGNELIDKHFGSSMHMFLVNIPRLDFGAIIPKGDFVTVCLLGEEIDDKMVEAFFQSAPVARCFPASWQVAEGVCHCSPKINIVEAATPFLDRVVLVGDCGVSRLYKDGIGSAYRTAKAAALTAVFSGVGADDFQRHYWSTYHSVGRDNLFGKLIFFVVHGIKKVRPLMAGTLAMTIREQSSARSAKRMSLVLWDMFTGSAPYRDVFFRTLDPRYLGRFALDSALCLFGGRGKGGAGAY